MAKEISDNDLIGAQTLANITQRAQERGLDVRRDDVRFVLEVVSEADPWFEQGASANLFAGRFRNFVVARCRGQGLNLSADELDLIDAWFAGGTLPQPQAQADAGACPDSSRRMPPKPPATRPRVGTGAVSTVRTGAVRPRPLVVVRRQPQGGDGEPRGSLGPAARRGRRLPAHRPHPPAQLTGRDVRRRRASPLFPSNAGTGLGAVERVESPAQLLQWLLMKVPSAQLADGLLQLGLRVHDDGPVPGDRLLDRLARNQQEADALLAGLNRDLIAAVEQHQRPIAGALADQVSLPSTSFSVSTPNGCEAERNEPEPSNT